MNASAPTRKRMATRNSTRNEILELHERELLRLENANLKEQIRAYQTALAELKESVKEDREIIRSLLRTVTAGNSKSASRTDINITK